MKLTDLQKEVSPVWEEKGYEVLKYDREAVKQKTKEAPMLLAASKLGFIS